MTIYAMAFKAQSGSLFAALDGISFAVNDKLKPPPKVAWPMGFETGNPTDVMFMEYDVQTEESFLAWATSQREAKAAQTESEQIPESNSLPDDQPTPVQAVSSPPDSNSVMNSTPVDPAPIPVPVNDTTGHVGPVFGLNSGSSILTPMPIAPTSTGSGLPTATAASALRNIDLKDFEREQDPFENLSLRVINDREELNKVFHVTSPPSQKPPAATTVPPSTATNFDPKVGSTQMYSGANVMNGLNSTGLSWGQPGQPWTATNHNVSNIPSVATRPQHNPYVGRVSGPFAECPNFPSSYYGTPSSDHHQHATAAPVLRSAKSTPDILSLSEDRAVTTARRTPPPPLTSDWSSFLASHNREQGTHGSHSCQTPVTIRSLPAAVGGSSPSQCHEYQSLSADAKSYADRVAAMGFELSDVAKVVSKHGIDDKLVLDHLCSLGKLKEKGFSSDTAADALLLYDNCVDKATVFLQLSKNFTELGFAQDQIKDALVRSNLDEEKSLDLLVGS